MKQTKKILKTYFETGDVPTEEQFEDLVDSIVHTDEVVQYGIELQGNTLSLTNNSEQNQVEFNDSFRGTYREIESLVNNNMLVEGKNYILEDYQTEYFIEGSNSSGIIEQKTISDLISGWAVLDANYEFDLNKGDTVEVVRLPLGYSGGLSVGDTTTVTSVSSDYYFKFANGMQSQVGLKFKYFYDRYTTIPQDIIVNDSNGKPVLKPKGIVNTEVHDGTAYMDMTPEENLNVPVESIVLKAATSNTFEEIGFSETYPGDIVYYNFNDTKIINDNQEIIGKRKGYIKKRKNTSLNIDANIDWRVYRSRRWLLGNKSITSFINENELVTSRVGYDNKFLFSSKNRTVASTNSFYVAQKPEGVFMNIDTNAIKKEFNYTVVSTIKAKDFTLFKIDANRNPVNVKQFVVDGVIYNSTFFGFGGEFNSKLNVNIVGAISQSTFVSNIICFGGNNNSFDNVTAIDAIEFHGDNNIFKNVQILSYFQVKKMQGSKLNNVVLGTVKGVIGGNPNPAPSTSWINFSSIINANIIDAVIGTAQSNLNIVNSKIVLSSLFFYYGPIWNSEDGTYGREVTNINNCIFSRVGLRMTSNLDRVNMSDMYFQDLNKANADGLFLYDIKVPLEIVNIKKNKYNHKLYYTELDIDNQEQVITLAEAI